VQVSLHYWQTNNLEWYDPAGLTTADGNLVITLSEQNPEYNHNLDYRGGTYIICFETKYAP